MVKTIHWPQEFEEEILSEPTGSTHLATRPGTLYFDTQYFKKGDVIDIRIGNKVIRKGMVQDELRTAKIKNLTQADFNLLKTSINSKETLKEFLSTRYNICIDDNSEITLVAYNNMNLVYLKENEDPHFC